MKNIRCHSSSVGLDIRLNEIRLIHLCYVNNIPEIEAIECLALPAHTIVEGRIKVFDHLIQALQTWVEKTNTHKFPTCVVLPTQSVISKRFQWSKKLTSKEQKHQIEEQLARYFPGFFHELCYDYTILPETDDANENVLLVATRQEQLNDYVNVAERAGLAVKIVDVDIYALARAASVAMSHKIDVSPRGILHVERYSVLFVVVVDNHEVAFHSQWNSTTIEELCTKLSNTIELLHSTHPQIRLNSLNVSGDAEHITHIISKIQNTLPLKLTLLRFSDEKIKINSAISFEKTNKLLEKMMVCFGLVLRRMSKW